MAIIWTTWNKSHATSSPVLDANMGAVRKSTYSARRPDFRRQLQRALSLSSFETEDTRSASKSSAGDTTEDQLSIHSENDGSSVQSGSVGRNHEAQIDPALFSTARDVEKIEGQRDLPEDRDMIALECVAEWVSQPWPWNYLR